MEIITIKEFEGAQMKARELQQSVLLNQILNVDETRDLGEATQEGLAKEEKLKAQTLESLTDEKATKSYQKLHSKYCTTLSKLAKLADDNQLCRAKNKSIVKGTKADAIQ